MEISGRTNEAQANRIALAKAVSSGVFSGMMKAGLLLMLIFFAVSGIVTFFVVVFTASAARMSPH